MTSKKHGLSWKMSLKASLTKQREEKTNVKQKRKYRSKTRPSAKLWLAYQNVVSIRIRIISMLVKTITLEHSHHTLILHLTVLPTRRFAFEAFLPADKKERKLILEELKNETRTIILYEAPHRLIRTLEELKETLGNRRMTLCRELTKRHETAFHTTIEELILYYQTEKPLGE